MSAVRIKNASKNDHFHLYSLSAVHSYDLYHMYTCHKLLCRTEGISFMNKCHHMPHDREHRHQTYLWKSLISLGLNVITCLSKRGGEITSSLAHKWDDQRKTVYDLLISVNQWFLCVSYTCAIPSQPELGNLPSILERLLQIRWPVSTWWPEHNSYI